MAFPQTPLGIGAELLINGVWTDITSDVRAASGITITRGRSSEGGQVDPATGTLTLQNAATYASRNPRSPYYGLLSRNTPMRIVVNAGDTQADFTGAAGNKVTTPDIAALDVTGDLDIRFEIAPTTWSGGTDYELIGKWATTGNQRSWYVTGGAVGALNFHWSTTGSNDLSYTGTINDLSTPEFRQAFRITLDVDNGAGGYTLTYYRADTMNGPWEQFEQTVTTSGTTSIFASSSPLEIGDISALSSTPFAGTVFHAEVRNGINGTPVAAPDFTTQTVGATSFTDSAGRVWTLAGEAALTNRRVRLWGEVAEWPPRWQPGGFDVTAPITLAGYFRRLKTGSTPLQSALRRALPNESKLLGYWPMEDAKGSTQAASPLPGIRPMGVSGLTFESDTSLPGSDALPSFGANAIISASLYGATAKGTGGGWTVAGVYKVDTMPTTLSKLWRAQINNSALNLVQVSASATQLKIDGIDSNGNSISFLTITDTGAIADFIGKWNQIRIRAVKSGANTLLYLEWIDVNTLGGWAYYTTLTGTAPGNVAVFAMSPLSTDFSGLTMGHIGIFDASDTEAYDAPADGFTGENAAGRFARVTSEENVLRGYQTGAIGRSPQAVGPQRVQTLFEIMQAATDADVGILYESRKSKAVRYRSHITLENQTPWLVVPYADVADPLEPTDDGQGTENDITVSRDGGSSTRAQQLAGPLNVQEPEDDPQGVGRYAQSYSLNVASDDQTEQLASWLLHQGTWDEARYPVVRVNLARNPELIAAATRVEIGDRIQITDPPAWLPPEPIDLLVQGYKESMDQYSWTIEYNCTPAGPWTVGTLEDLELSRADTDGSQLACAVAATDTVLPVNVTAGPAWVTAAPNVILNPSFDVPGDTWAGTRGTSNAVVTHETAITHTPPGAIRITRVDPVDTGTMNMLPSEVYVAAAGQTWAGRAWVYSGGNTAGPQAMRTALVWRNSTGTDTYIYGSTVTVPTGVWQELNVSSVLPTGAVGVRLAVEGRSGWTVGQYWIADDVRLANTGGADTNGDDFPFDIRVGGEVMTVHGITAGVADAFNRTVSSGWGTADTGQAWTTNGGTAANYSISPGAGMHAVASVNVNRITVTGPVGPDFDAQISMSTPVLATGANQQGYVLGRYTDANNYYGARLEFTPAKAVILTIVKVVAGAPASFTSYTTSLTHAAGTLFRVRFQSVGSILRAKAWLASSTEPADWQTTVTDTDLTGTGQVGVRSRFLTGNTNTLPVTMTFANFSNPQVFTVARSANGIVKAQTAGTDVRLATPTIAAL